MFVVGQTVAGTEEVPELEFDIVGTTGNLYKTSIGQLPACNCPDSIKGNQCKHICYVLAKVLKAPAHLQYQLAFLSSELREIYQNSPLRHVKEKSEEPDTNGNRKPVEGDCPICFMEFEPGKEDIVWCRAACGNNIHKTCFQKWAATQNAQGVRCVYCRSPWQTEDADGKVDMDMEQLLSQGRIGEDGYINVASQMGLSGERDCSTYYRPWGRPRSYYSGWHSWDNRGYY
ncbi:RING finger protein [Aspergillus lucknowensis]|uniref:RING finger domain protein n=1 Tax=Aspergillus lucknowensis TaxID=176173 RepID=A0ABR4LVE7_9EURO